MKTNFKFNTQLIAFAYMLLVSVFFVGCDEKPPKKPFMITFTYPNSSNGGGEKYTRYEYYDADGYKYVFYDLNEKYSVGDTIR